MPISGDGHPIGYCACSQGSRGENAQNLLLDGCRLLEYLAENLLEFLYKRTAGDKTESPYVLVGGSGRVDLLQILGHATRHGQHIQNVTDG